MLVPPYFICMYLNDTKPMKQSKILFLLLLPAVSTCLAQNINYEMMDIKFYRLPLKPLAQSVKTYSVSLQDLGADLAAREKDSLLARALVITGFERIGENGDVQAELVISPLSIMSKEVKDRPLENEKNGLKTVIHQYSYYINYSFPTKIRLTVNGNLITEQDFPGFFQTQYYPRINNSLTNLQQEYDQDIYFLSNLRFERVTERTKQIKDWLFSNYGRGMAYEVIYAGYIKDKKGLYDDINKAFASMRSAYQYAHGRKDYRDETFNIKINEAVAIYEKALLESSDDKKARIDPKVTAMINYNLALASYGQNDFDKAQEHLGKMQKAGNETEYVASALKNMVTDKRARFVANGKLGGPIEEGTKTQATARKSTRNFIVPKPGDTLEVSFILPSREVMRFGDSLWLQDRIIVMKNNKRVEFNPGEIHGYSYNGIFRESLTWVKDMNTNPWTFEKKFCRRIVDGAIPVFKCYQVKNGIQDTTEKFVEPTMRYTAPDKRLIEVGFMNFNKAVSKLVSKYPELSERVKNGAYSDKDFLVVIREYNQWAKNNKL
jgi:tetratricopeptide (TPR) repeat protein